ncbi:uncharacterized protein LOC106464495 [Limulus polyphemus]|uniref:Uncharacterized protein LOC106464495 n=1 Tax=Limulus polyphemus TaxID=6850 RepID=A0ABM1SWB9_LIMPO|nr:uncharacterized protein LOC106464495 [Limulus polyphemus]
MDLIGKNEEYSLNNTFIQPISGIRSLFFCSYNNFGIKVSKCNWLSLLKRCLSVTKTVDVRYASVVKQLRARPNLCVQKDAAEAVNVKRADAVFLLKGDAAPAVGVMSANAVKPQRIVVRI